MAGCTNKRLIGRNSTLEFAIQCTDVDPATSTLLPLGAVTTKSFSIDGNELTANDSFSSSGFTENQLSTSTLTLSVSGNYVRDADSYPNAGFISDLLIERFGAVAQDLSKDPIVLIRYVRPDVTLTAYMILKSISVEDPDAEYSTFTAEFSNATSPTYPPTLVKTV